MVVNRFALGVVVGLLWACGPFNPPIGGGGDAGRPEPPHDGGGNDSGAGGNPFCQVSAVLRAKCGACHSNPPKLGAPFSLVTYADLQRREPSGPTWQSIAARLEHATYPMPPIGAPQLTSDERALLLKWLNYGAPGADCDESLSCLARDPQNPSRCPRPAVDCEAGRYFRAHAPGDSRSKYTVPRGANEWPTCFYFNNPFTARKN